MEEFSDQGGAASANPSPFVRWLTSVIMTRLGAEQYIQRRHARAEKQRRRDKAPHRVEYFHQVDDSYSHIAAQVLAHLAERYDIELVCYLVTGPQGKNVAETDLLLQLSRYDAHHVAPAYGLAFPEHPAAPNPDLVQLASEILSAQTPADFAACAPLVGNALWTDDEATLLAVADRYGKASAEACAAKLAIGNARRAELKHYSGAMFYYGGEWYWGVDRLYHLEQRLASLGADRQPAQPLVAPRPEVSFHGPRDSGSLTLEFFVSLRSPYTAIIFQRVVDFARTSGVKLCVRPVLPMVMRGVPATREKGFYIFADAAREARAAGVNYGKFYDPIGKPVQRCYALYPWAVQQGKGVELLSSFLEHAFSRGVNTNHDRGLRQVVEAAGLSWSDAKPHLGDRDWEATLEANRLAMYNAGLWGVPSFRLLSAEGDELLAVWGQDRLWLVARKIQRQLLEPDGSKCP